MVFAIIVRAINNTRSNFARCGCFGRLIENICLSALDRPATSQSQHHLDIATE